MVGEDVQKAVNCLLLLSRTNFHAEPHLHLMRERRLRHVNQ